MLTLKENSNVSSNYQLDREVELDNMRAILMAAGMGTRVKTIN